MGKYKEIDSVIIEEEHVGHYIVKDSATRKPIAKVSEIVYPTLEKFIEHFHSNDLAGIVCATQDCCEANSHKYHLILRKNCEYSKEKREDVAVLIVKSLDNNYHPRHEHLVKDK